MVLVTPAIAVIVFVIIVIVAVMVAAAIRPNNFDNTRIKTFIGCMAGFGIFVTFLFYFSVVGLQQQQQRLSFQDVTSSIVAMRDNILAEIQRAVETIPQFAYSLLPLLACGAIYSTGDLCSSRGCIQIYNLSSKIFSLFQAVVLSYAFFDVDPVALNATFLQHTNSPYLYEEWEKQYINYSMDVQNYTNLLFEFGRGVTIQEPEQYRLAAVKMVGDVRYGRINFNYR